MPFGTGCVDFSEIFRSLAALNYRGAWLIEMWAKNDGLDSERIAEAKAWLTDKYQQGFLAPQHEVNVNSGVKYAG